MAIKFNVNGRVEHYESSYLLPDHELGTLKPEDFKGQGINDKDPLYKTFSDKWIKIQTDPNWLSISILDKESAREIAKPNERKFGMRYSIFIPNSGNFSTSGLIEALLDFYDWSKRELTQYGLGHKVNPEEWRAIKDQWTHTITQNPNVFLSRGGSREKLIREKFLERGSNLRKDNTGGIALSYENFEILASNLPNWLVALGDFGKLSLFPTDSSKVVAMAPGEPKPNELSFQCWI